VILTARWFPGAARGGGPWLAALALVAGCGAKRPDDSPTGVVKQFVAASLKADTEKRHEELFRLLGPRTRARLEAAAKRATVATGGKRRYQPFEMLSASFRPSARGDWNPKTYKLASRSGDTARVEVRGEKKGQVQVVHLVRVKEQWRIELEPAKATAGKPGT
jgi:hypothetical protein